MANQTYAPLEKRQDGRVYVWHKYSSVAHLTETSSLSFPAWTVCGRQIPTQWRVRAEGVLRPLCFHCKRWNSMVATAQPSEVKRNRDG